jgi:hypothetical protein
MKTVFADTSYYIALVNSLDEHHRAAYEFTQDFDGAVVTTAWIVLELANCLCRAVNRPFFVSLLRDLQQDRRVLMVPPTQELFARGLDLYVNRSDKDWSLTDCISFVVMEEQGLRDALTIDRHFEQAGFGMLLK